MEEAGLSAAFQAMYRGYANAGVYSGSRSTIQERQIYLRYVQGVSTCEGMFRKSRIVVMDVLYKPSRVLKACLSRGG
jgi:hypothetical protein